MRYAAAAERTMNADELYTRCPTCRTVFRTHEAQLSMQAGKVRCGQCRMVFDGRAQLVDLSPGADPAPDENALGPPTVTLRDSVALHPVPAPFTTEAAIEPGDGTAESAISRPPADTSFDPMPASDEAAAEDPLAARAADTAKAAQDEEIVPYDWEDEVPARPAVRWALGVLSALLVLLLAGQAVFHFRHAIAARYPEWRPILVDACALVGCSVDAVKARNEITIESHDLQADPAHQGLLILQLTLRNRARNAVAFPHLELEILDLGGQPQVRRAFAPVEYAGGAADFDRGMPAGAEWNVKLFLDASSINARGYNLDLFYP